MSVQFQSFDRRLALALAFSMLLHAAFLWLPGMSLPRLRIQSSVLTVRMEQVLRPTEVAQAIPARPKVVPPVPETAAPKSAKPQPATPLSATTQISVVPEIASSVAVTPAVSSVPPAAPVTAGQPASFPEIDPNRDKSGIPPLPLHAQLRFAFYLEGSSFSIGDMFQELDIKQGRYTLQVELEKAGLASWFNSTQLTQISRGVLLANGDLAPQEFLEEATDAKGVHHRYEAAFDWNAKQLRFADGTGSQLPLGTQDMLSLLYQLSQYSMRTEIMHLTVTDGSRLRNIQLEVGASEEIATPMGRLHVLHINQLHNAGEPWIEAWLAGDYHMLPVRYLQMGADGKISQELVIKEIHVSDDQPVK